LRFDPAEIGLPRCSPGDLRGGNPAHNAAVARSVLGGAAGAVRETVLLNSAAALVAEAGVPDPAELNGAFAAAYARSAEAVDSGAAADLLDRWIEASHRLAKES